MLRRPVRGQYVHPWRKSAWMRRVCGALFAHSSSRSVGTLSKLKWFASRSNRGSWVQRVSGNERKHCGLVSSAAGGQDSRALEGQSAAECSQVDVVKTLEVLVQAPYLALTPCRVGLGCRDSRLALTSQLLVRLPLLLKLLLGTPRLQSLENQLLRSVMRQLGLLFRLAVCVLVKIRAAKQVAEFAEVPPVGVFDVFAKQTVDDSLVDSACHRGSSASQFVGIVLHSRLSVRAASDSRLCGQQLLLQHLVRGLVREGGFFGCSRSLLHRFEGRSLGDAQGSGLFETLSELPELAAGDGGETG